MIYSLTDKLKFADNPQIEIKGKVLTVHAEAETALQLLDIMEKKGEMAAVLQAPELLFSAKDLKTILDFKLSMEDYSTLMLAAMSLCIGQDPDDTSEQD